MAEISGRIFETPSIGSSNSPEISSNIFESYSIIFEISSDVCEDLSHSHL